MKPQIRRTPRMYMDPRTVCDTVVVKQTDSEHFLKVLGATHTAWINGIPARFTQAATEEKLSNFLSKSRLLYGKGDSLPAAIVDLFHKMNELQKESKNVRKEKYEFHFVRVITTDYSVHFPLERIIQYLDKLAPSLYLCDYLYQGMSVRFDI